MTRTRDRFENQPARSSLFVPWILLAALVVPGCGGLSQRSQELYEQAQLALDNKDWQRAHQLLSEVLEQNPEFPPAYIARGQAEFGMKSFDKAVEDFDVALKRGGLSPDERFVALTFKGRCVIEKGRDLRRDLNGMEKGARSKLLKEVRTTFVRANALLVKAVELKPDGYDAVLWRAYCFVQVENHKRALELLRTCEKVAPNRWEHRFVKALATEGLYKINPESLSTYLELARTGRSDEYAVVFEHLITTFPKVEQDSQRRIFRYVENFVKAVPGHPSTLDSFLNETQEQILREEREERIRNGIARAEAFAENQKYQNAIELLETLMAKEGDSEVAAQSLQDVRERWSLSLEARAVTRSTSDDKEQLRAALEDYQMAQRLTKKVDRLGTLQQKINAVTLVLTRRETALKLERSFEQLKKELFAEALAELRGISLDDLTPEDTDLYHYLRGVASYHLGHWKVAAKSLEQIVHRDYPNIDTLQGMALMKGDDAEAGARILINVPAERRTDEVHRSLAEYFLKGNDLEKAIGYLGAIKKKTNADFEAELEARETLGRQFFEDHRYDAARDHLVAAKNLLEQKLDRKAPDVYLYLGHSYFHSEDFERAKKAYTDLSSSRLTEAERTRCRELYLQRAKIYLQERLPDLAYEDLSTFERLGGEFADESLVRKYSWLVATYADYMPLTKIHYWTYVNVTTGKSSRLSVGNQVDGVYKIERHEDHMTTEESWAKEGTTLIRKLGGDIWRLPINLEPATDTFPSHEYRADEGRVKIEYKSEIQSNGEVVELADGRTLRNCIKVQLKKTRSEPGKAVSFLVYVFYFAPDVGEVKREVLLDGEKVSEVVLSSWAYRSDTLGN